VFMQFQFHDKKCCVIFSPDQSTYLYRVPQSLIAREYIDFTDPDFLKMASLTKSSSLYLRVRLSGNVVDARRTLALYALPHTRFFYKLEILSSKD
jgi:hypothetical protein